jgi:hypothetical protein
VQLLVALPYTLWLALQQVLQLLLPALLLLALHCCSGRKLL